MTLAELQSWLRERDADISQAGFYRGQWKAVVRDADAADHIGYGVTLELAVRDAMAAHERAR